MAISRLAQLLLSIAVALPAWAAGKPADKIAPAAINDLSVMVAARSVVLRFTATGDDGASGTAAGYDVRYATASCLGDPSTWATATRANLQKPVAAGTADAFIVRPLAAGTTYCFAVRVRDEIPNYSPGWTTALATTLGTQGDWPMVAMPPDPSASLTPENLYPRGLVAVLDEPSATGEPRVLATWLIADNPITTTVDRIIGVRFAAISAPTSDGALIQPCPPLVTTDCVEKILLSDPLLSTYIDELRSNHAVASIPGPDGIVGILVRGTKLPTTRKQSSEERTVLLERTTSGGWTSDRVPCALPPISGGIPASTIAYVPDGSGGSSPVLTCVSGNTLNLVERLGGPGSPWKSTALFSRSGGFHARHVFTTPGGDLGVWTGATSPMGEPAIYAVRSPADDANGNWSVWDSGSRYAPDDSVIYRLGFDAFDELVIATTPYSSGTQVVAIRQDAFVPLPGWPAAGSASLVPQSAWQEVVSASLGDWITLEGLSADPCDAAIHVGALDYYNLPNGTILELRIASVVSSPAASSPVDHVNGGFPGLVGLPNGDVALLTTWAPFGGSVRYSTRPPQDVYLSRGLVGSCPPAP